MKGMKFDSFPEFMSSFHKIEPLSNFQIIEKCKELKIENFKGVFMRNELNKNRKPTSNECLILNIDHSNNTGTHWTSLFIKNDIPFYFDSYGFRPPLEVLDYCGRLNKSEGYYHDYKIQKPDEVICGHYCIYIIYKLSNGYEFEEILDELLKL